MPSIRSAAGHPCRRSPAPRRWAANAPRRGRSPSCCQHRSSSTGSDGRSRRLPAQIQQTLDAAAMEHGKETGSRLAQRSHRAHGPTLGVPTPYNEALTWMVKNQCSSQAGDAARRSTTTRRRRPTRRSVQMEHRVHPGLAPHPNPSPPLDAGSRLESATYLGSLAAARDAVQPRCPGAMRRAASR